MSSASSSSSLPTSELHIRLKARDWTGALSRIASNPIECSLITDGLYPLHVASLNPDLPTSLFSALVAQHPNALAIPDGERNLVIHNLMYLHRGAFDKMKIAIDSHPAVVAASATGDERCLRHCGVRCKNNHGWLPLHYACGHGKQPMKIVHTLFLLYPEGLAIADRAGRTPLHWAIENHEPADVVTIASWDKTVLQIKDDNDRLPIHYAFASLAGPANYSLSCVAPFVDMLPSSILVVDVDGKTPLDQAEDLLRRAEELLVEAPDSPPDAERATLLRDSVQFLRFRCGKRPVGRAPVPLRTSGDGRNAALGGVDSEALAPGPFAAAMWEWQDPAAGEWFPFVDQGVNEKLEQAIRAGGGEASLVLSVGSGSFKIDVESTGDKGVATFLKTNQTMPVRRRLNTTSPLPSPVKIVPTPSLEYVLHSLIDDKNWKQAAELLKTNPSSAAATRDGLFPLHLAITMLFQPPSSPLSLPPFSFFQSLVDANPSALSAHSSFGKLPLHLICSSSSTADSPDVLRIAALILDRTPPPHGPASRSLAPAPGWTALHFAAVAGNVPVIKLLLSKYPQGVRDRTEAHCKTPYDKAVEAGHSQDVLALLEDKTCGTPRLLPPIDTSLFSKLPPDDDPVDSDWGAVTLMAIPAERNFGSNGGILTTPLTGAQVYVPEAGDDGWAGSKLTVVEIDRSTVEKSVMAKASPPETPNSKKLAGPVIRFEEVATFPPQATSFSSSSAMKGGGGNPPFPDAPLPLKARNVTVRLPIDSNGSNLAAWAENDQGIWSAVPDSSITSINDHYATFAFQSLPHTLTATCDAVATIDVVSILAYRSEPAAEGTTILVCLISNTSEQRTLAEQVMSRKKMTLLEESFDELRLRKNDVVTVKCESPSASFAFSSPLLSPLSKKYSNKRMSFEFVTKAGNCVIRVSGGEDEEEVALSLKFDVSLPKTPKPLRLVSRTNQTTLIKLDDFERQANARSYEVRIVKLSVRDRSPLDSREFNPPESFDAKRWETIEALAGEREWSIGGVFAAYAQVRAVNNVGVSGWSGTLYISKEEAQRLLQEQSSSPVVTSSAPPTLTAATSILSSSAGGSGIMKRTSIESSSSDPSLFSSHSTSILNPAYSEQCKQFNSQAKLFTKACAALSGIILLVIRKISTLDVSDESTIRNCNNTILSAIELIQSCSSPGWLSRLIIPPNPSWIRLFTERHQELINACVEAGAFEFIRYLDRTSEYHCDFDVDYHGLARDHFIEEFRKVNADPLRIEHRIHDFCIDFGCCTYDDFRRELFSSSLATAMKQVSSGFSTSISAATSYPGKPSDKDEARLGFVQAVGSPRNAIKTLSSAVFTSSCGIFLSGVRHEVGRGSKLNFLEKLSRSLATAGFSTFTSDDDHREGWSETLVEALDACILKCGVFVVILSPSYNDNHLSKQSTREYEIAKRQKRPIIVLSRIEDALIAKKAVLKFEADRAYSSPLVTLDVSRDDEFTFKLSELERVFSSQFRIQPVTKTRTPDVDDTESVADSLGYGTFSDHAFDPKESIADGQAVDAAVIQPQVSPEVHKFLEKNGWSHLAPQLQYPSSLSDLVRMNDPSQMEDLRALVLEKSDADQFCKKIEQLAKDTITAASATTFPEKSTSSSLVARRSKSDVIHNVSIAARRVHAEVQQSWDQEHAVVAPVAAKSGVAALTDDAESSSLRLLSETADYLESLDMSSKIDSLSVEVTSKIESYVVKVDGVLKEIKLAVLEVHKQRGSDRAAATKSSGSTSFFGFPNLAVIARNKLSSKGKGGGGGDTILTFSSARFEKTLSALTGQIDKLINLSI